MRVAEKPLPLAPSVANGRAWGSPETRLLDGSCELTPLFLALPVEKVRLETLSPLQGGGNPYTGEILVVSPPPCLRARCFTQNPRRLTFPVCSTPADTWVQNLQRSSDFLICLTAWV